MEGTEEKQISYTLILLVFDSDLLAVSCYSSFFYVTLNFQSFPSPLTFLLLFLVTVGCTEGFKKQDMIRALTLDSIHDTWAQKTGLGALQKR